MTNVQLDSLLHDRLITLRMRGTERRMLIRDATWKTSRDGSIRGTMCLADEQCTFTLAIERLLLANGVLIVPDDVRPTDARTFPQPDSYECPICSYDPCRCGPLEPR